VKTIICPGANHNMQEKDFSTLDAPYLLASLSGSPSPINLHLHVGYGKYIISELIIISEPYLVKKYKYYIFNQDYSLPSEFFCVSQSGSFF
jgi:hypothetical protein